MTSLTLNSVNNYHSNLHAFEAEAQLIAKLTAELEQTKSVVTNKDLILSLIMLIESESDVIQSDICRNALEMVVHRTPDDI